MQIKEIINKKKISNATCRMKDGYRYFALKDFHKYPQKEQARPFRNGDC